MSTFEEALTQFESIFGVSEPKKLSYKDKETLYASAYGMYQVGDYEKGSWLFMKLVLHDPFDLRFWKGLASSLQMKLDYQGALQAWAVNALLSGHSPQPHFHAAECYLSLNNLTEAKKALALAEMNLKTDDPLRAKIRHLKEVTSGK